MNARLALAALGCAVALTVTKHEADELPSGHQHNGRSVLSILRDKVRSLSSGGAQSITKPAPIIDPAVLKRYGFISQEPGKPASITNFTIPDTTTTPNSQFPDAEPLKDFRSKEYSFRRFFQEPDNSGSLTSPLSTKRLGSEVPGGNSTLSATTPNPGAQLPNDGALRDPHSKNYARLGTPSVTASKPSIKWPSGQLSEGLGLQNLSPKRDNSRSITGPVRSGTPSTTTPNPGAQLLNDRAPASDARDFSLGPDKSVTVTSPAGSGTPSTTRAPNTGSKKDPNYAAETPQGEATSMPEKFFSWLQAILDRPFQTVRMWDEPWKWIGSTVLNLVRFLLKVLGFVLILLAVCLAGLLTAAAGLGISAATGPWAKKLYRKVKVAENLARLRTVASAGLGSGFSFLLFLALWELWEGTWGSIFLNLSTITLVAIGMVLFVEPLTEWIRERIGLEKEQTVWKHDHRWHLRGAAVVILAAASLAHGLLHDNLSKGKLDSVDALFWALLIPALITGAWIVGAKSPTWRAPWLGAIAGLVLGIGLPLLVVWIFSVDDVKMWIITENGMKWGVAGLLGGLALDYSWGRNHIHWTAGAIIAAFVFASLYSSKDLADVFKDLFISIGWAGGLLAVEPLARHCLRPTAQAILVKAPAVG